MLTIEASSGFGARLSACSLYVFGDKTYEREVVVVLRVLVVPVDFVVLEVELLREVEVPLDFAAEVLFAAVELFAVVERDRVVEVFRAGAVRRFGTRTYSTASGLSSTNALRMPIE